MLYEYKLEGKEESWQMLKGKSEVTYYDLSSGKYIFKVRRAGDVNSEVSLSIRVPVALLKCRKKEARELKPHFSIKAFKVYVICSPLFTKYLNSAIR